MTKRKRKLKVVDIKLKKLPANWLAHLLEVGYVKVKRRRRK